MRSVGRVATMICLSIIVTITLSSCGKENDSVFPKGSLPPEAATTVDESEFLSTRLMREWHAGLDTLGNRPTGSPAHESYIDWLYAKLAKAGVKDLHFEDVEMEQWAASSWSLAVSEDGETFEPVSAATYVPYSGSTPPEGLTAELEYLAPAQIYGLMTGALSFAELAPSFYGKIVLVDLPVLPLTSAFFLSQAISVFDPDNTILPDDPYERPWLGIDLFINIMEGLEAVGAKGMVVINNDAGTEALSKMYIPYDGTIRHLPGVYVDRVTGAQLRNEASENNSVRLSLSASVKTINTRNLIGFIPGKSDEFIAIHSHTDGTNGVEDNGPDVIVDIAQYISRLPKNSLERGVMIMLSSGHFAGGNGIVGFLDRHKDDGLLDRMKAVVTIEHLGLDEWLFNEQGVLAPTGKKEASSLFMPNIPALIRASEAWAEHADASPAFIMPPLHPNASGAPNDAVWPGEGQYFWGKGRIPTVNYITGPDYLLNWGISTVDFVDFDLLHRETVAFTQMVLDLTRTPTNDFNEANVDPVSAFIQPIDGPGGSDYPYPSYTKTAFTSNEEDSWIYQPSPLPTGPLPVIAYLHGWSIDSGLNLNENMVIHLAKKGYAVIYCNYQNSLTMPELFESRAAANIRDGLDYMAAHPLTSVQPSENPDGSIKFGLVGWSAGGVMSVNLAANYQEDGVPKPGFVMAMEANNGGVFNIPMQNASSISPDTNILMVMAQDDDENTYNTSSTFFNQMTQIPDTRKQWVGLYSDDHGIPALVADHMWECAGGGEEIDALDYYGSYKWSVAIANDTFYGTDRTFWHGNTVDQTFMGQWGDGTAVTAAEVSLTPFWPGTP